MAGTVVVNDPNGSLPSPRSIARPDADHLVGMGQWTFTPDAVTVEVGDSVGWLNGTGIAHSVTASTVPTGADYFASGGFDTLEAAEADWYGPRENDVLAEAPFVHTFETPGEYAYVCILHETNMRGTVTVEPA